MDPRVTLASWPGGRPATGRPATVEPAGLRIEDLLSARVDVIQSPAGPLVLAVALTEPSLGFRYAGPGALGRFADAIAETAAE